MTIAESYWLAKINGLSPEQQHRLHDLLLDRALIASEINAPVRLLAYYEVYANCPEPDEESLREHLRTYLPPAMIPAAFMVLDQLPVTGTGKLDRSNLPEPGHGIPGKNAEGPGPNNEIESDLVIIWEEVLGVEPVRRDDDFFSLGGDSLIAIRVIARIRSMFDVALTPRDIFETPILKELAATVALRSTGSAASEEFEL